MNVVSEIDLLSGGKRTSRQNENSKSPEISRAEHESFSYIQFAVRLTGPSKNSITSTCLRSLGGGNITI